MQNKYVKREKTDKKLYREIATDTNKITNHVKLHYVGYSEWWLWDDNTLFQWLEPLYSVCYFP